MDSVIQTRIYDHLRKTIGTTKGPITYIQSRVGHKHSPKLLLETNQQSCVKVVKPKMRFVLDRHVVYLRIIKK